MTLPRAPFWLLAAALVGCGPERAQRSGKAFHVDVPDGPRNRRPEIMCGALSGGTAPSLGGCVLLNGKVAAPADGVDIRVNAVESIASTYDVCRHEGVIGGWGEPGILVTGLDKSANRWSIAYHGPGELAFYPGQNVRIVSNYVSSPWGLVGTVGLYDAMGPILVWTGGFGRFEERPTIQHPPYFSRGRRVCSDWYSTRKERCVATKDDVSVSMCVTVRQGERCGEPWPLSLYFHTRGIQRSELPPRECGVLDHPKEHFDAGVWRRGGAVRGAVGAP